MGIFDFLGDLSSKRNKELGLGGLQSLLGTRKAAEAGARGDEMMKITGSDSLPGYFNEQTREYVPWYVDLFDGGGLNSAGGAANAKAPEAAAGLLGGGNAQPQARPALGGQLSDMERLNRMPGVDPRNLGGAEGYGQTGIAPGGTIVPLDEILTPEEIARRDANARLNQIKNGNSTFADFVRMDNSGQPASFPPSNTNYDPRNMGGASGYGQTGISPMQNDPTSNPEYQRFVQDLTNAGGFERELQDPEWLMRTFEVGKAEGRL